MSRVKFKKYREAVSGKILDEVESDVVSSRTVLFVKMKRASNQLFRRNVGEIKRGKSISEKDLAEENFILISIDWVVATHHLGAGTPVNTPFVPLMRFKK